MTMKRPTNRGEVQKMLGAERNADGSLSIPRCSKCGATAMRIVWSGKNGLAGDVKHELTGGTPGCMFTVDSAIAEHVPAEPEPVPQVEVQPEMPAPIVKHDPFAAIAYVGFHTAVSFGSEGAQSWSRAKPHGVKVVDLTSDGGVIFGDEAHEYQVPGHNISYIKRKRRD